MNDMKKTGFFAFLLLLGMWACEYETIVPKVVELPDEPVSFATQVAPIFVNANCISCHGAGMSPDLRADKSYNSLVAGGFVDTENPSESKVVTQIASGHGTAINVSAEDKAFLLKWIEEGAKDN